MNITSGKLPSYSTIRRIIEGLDKNDLLSIFFLMIKMFSNYSKSSDHIAVVRKLTENMDLTNNLLSLDAAHCNKATTKAIIDSNNDYLITVKKNQIKLFEELELLTKIENSIDNYEAKDSSHGRKINRKLLLFDGKNIKHKNYQHIKSIIEIERSGKRGKKSIM